MHGFKSNISKTGLTVFTQFILVTATLLIMFGATLPLAHAAPSDSQMTIDAKLRPNGLRLMFYCKQPVSFTAALAGNKLYVNFNRSFSGSFGGAIAKLEGAVSEGAYTNNGKTMVFTLAPDKYKVRKFISEDFVGVDITKQKPATESASAAKEAPTSKPAPEPAPQVAAAAMPPQKPVVAAKPIDEKTVLKAAPAKAKPAKPAPVAEEEEEEEEEEEITTNITPPKPSAASKTPKPAAAKIVEAPIKKAAPAVEKKAVIAQTAPALSVPAPPPARPKKTDVPATNTQTLLKSDSSTSVPSESLEHILAPAKPPVPTPELAAPKTAAPPAAAYAPAAAPVAATASVPTAAQAPAPTPAPTAAPLIKGAPVTAAPVPVVKMVGEELPVTTITSTHGKIISFPWKQDVAAAVFFRSGYLWIIFDKAQHIPLAPLVASFSGAITNAEQLPSNRYTLLRLQGNALSNIKVTRQHFTWNVEVALPGKPAFMPFKLVAQHKTPLTKGVFFPAERIGEMIQFIDPELDDEMIIFPFYLPDTGVSVERLFVDFTLLKTAQGFALANVADNLLAVRIPSGIEINSNITKLSKPQSLNERSEADSIDETAASLYRMQAWQGDKERSYASRQAHLLGKVLTADHGRKSQRQLSLAQFYFANDYISETIGMLKLIQQTNAPFMATPAVKQLVAATYFRANRLNEAKAIFDTITPEGLTAADLQEIKFWQTAIQASLKAPNEQLDYAAHKELFLKQYSLALRHQFAQIALESQMRHNNIASVEKLITALEADKPSGQFKNNLVYYKGIIALKKGEEKKALKLLEPLTTNIDDRFNRARASFAITQHMVNSQQMTTKDAISKLNSIRNVWRGDELEKEVLKFLGEQYGINKQYTDALRVWRQVVSSFPNSEESLLLAAKMTKLFIYVFSKEGSQTINDLNAIALYYEFREITPIGRMGDLIIQQLAYRLIKLDLLDRAAALLTHQIRYRLKDQERLEFGTKLALIHMLNKKPALALEALDATEDSALTADAKERLYLRAKALKGLKRSDKALELLRRDHTLEADRIRLDIAWESANWKNIDALLAPVYKERHKESEELSLQESNDLMRLAVSAIMLKKKEELATLYAAYYEKLPKASPLRDAFKFLATDKGAVNYKALDQSLHIAETQSFLDKYRQLIEKDSLNPPKKK